MNEWHTELVGRNKVIFVDRRYNIYTENIKQTPTINKQLHKLGAMWINIS